MLKKYLDTMYLNAYKVQICGKTAIVNYYLLESNEQFD